MQIIEKYFPNLDSTKHNQLAMLYDLYFEWNTKINVVSRKDFENLYLKHVLHSLAIVKKYDFKKGISVVDIGCGGGFPGVPLAIMFPEVSFTLVDSIKKKLTVVDGVSEALGLNNVQTIHERAEKLKTKFDFVISRAVTELPRFVMLTKHLLKPGKNGIIYLKGGDFEDEISQIRYKCEITNINGIFEEAFFDTKKIVYVQIT